MNVPIPWNGDAMTYVLEHVRCGVLRVDPDGSIWRCATRRGTHWNRITPRRAENVGNKGYLRVSIQKPDGCLATIMAHRLVHEVLIGPIPKGLQINHKDLNKTNNAPSWSEGQCPDDRVPQVIRWHGKWRRMYAEVGN